MKNIRIYYGMSGALKGATIKSQITNKEGPYSGCGVMESAIKPWKSYQFGIFDGLTEYNDLTYAILHMVRLREFMEENSSSSSLLIERGVSDTLFYHYNNDLGGSIQENPSFIEKVIYSETALLLPDFFKIEKILLIQNDRDFVKDVVLSDEYRKRTFNDNPDLYFDLQEKYIDFTTKYNQIDNVVRIDNAREYVVNTLGEIWNDNKV